MMWIGYSAHTMRLSICMKTLHNLLYLGGYDTKGKAHYVEAPYFKYTDTISGVINDAIEDITGAPWFCYVDGVSIKNTETSLMQMFELDSCNKENIKMEVCSLVKGWITRDARIIPEKRQY